MSEAKRPNEPGRSWIPVIIIFLSAGFVAVLWSVAAGIPAESWLAFSKFSKDFGPLIIGALGVVFLGWRTVLADSQSRLANQQSVLAQDQQHLAIDNALFDQFQRGVTMLDSSSESIRIAGLNTLNEVVKTSQTKYGHQAEAILRPYIEKLPPATSDAAPHAFNKIRGSEFSTAIKFYDNVKIDCIYIEFIKNIVFFNYTNIPSYMKFSECNILSAIIKINSENTSSFLNKCHFLKCNFCHTAPKYNITAISTPFQGHTFTDCSFTKVDAFNIDFNFENKKNSNIQIFGCNISDYVPKKIYEGFKSIIYFTDDGMHFNIDQKNSINAIPCWCWNDMIPTNCSDAIKDGRVLVVSAELRGQDSFLNELPTESLKDWQRRFPQHIKAPEFGN